MASLEKHHQPEDRIIHSILVVRGKKVILDSDLARLYGVETKRLNEQVKRNIDKFPEDFLFQLTQEEFDILKSQNATSSSDWGEEGFLPMGLLNMEQSRRQIF